MVEGEIDVFDSGMNVVDRYKRILHKLVGNYQWWIEKGYICWIDDKDVIQRVDYMNCDFAWRFELRVGVG